MAGKAFNLSKGVFSFNGRKGLVVPKSGDYTAEMVGALAIEDAIKFNYKTLLPHAGNKWWKIGYVSTSKNFNLYCMLYDSMQGNPSSPDMNMFGLAGNIAISFIRGSIVGLIRGADTQARIVLCNDGTIWGNRNNRFGYCYASAIRIVNAVLYDNVEESADSPSGDIIWDSYDNSYVVTTQQRQNVTEYQNPPMMLGVEYRTTERYKEKPVYAKLVNFGKLPNATSAGISHGSKNVLTAISGSLIGQDGTLLNIYDGITQFTIGSTIIVVRTNKDMSSVICNVLMKYIKSTD